jgi:hypothetical protein
MRGRGYRFIAQLDQRIEADSTCAPSESEPLRYVGRDSSALIAPGQAEQLESGALAQLLEDFSEAAWSPSLRQRVCALNRETLLTVLEVARMFGRGRTQRSLRFGNQRSLTLEFQAKPGV